MEIHVCLNLAIILSTAAYDDMRVHSKHLDSNLVSATSKLYKVIQANHLPSLSLSFKKSV